MYHKTKVHLLCSTSRESISKGLQAITTLTFSNIGWKEEVKSPNLILNIIGSCPLKRRDMITSCAFSKSGHFQSSVVFTIYKIYDSDPFSWLFVAKKLVMPCKPLAERQEVQHSAVLSNSIYIYPYPEVINLHCRFVVIYTAGAVVIFWASNITQKILHQIYACEWLFLSNNTVFLCFIDPICIHLNKLKSNPSDKIIPHIISACLFPYEQQPRKKCFVNTILYI